LHIHAEFHSFYEYRTRNDSAEQRSARSDKETVPAKTIQ